MKKLTFLLCLLLIGIQAYSQFRKEPNQLLFRPATHSSNLKSTANPYNGKSFYQSKADWQTVIDTTWGPGLPLNEKLAIFDAYTQVLTISCASFNSLGIDPTEWNSIKASYRQRIDESTSKGDFAALMGRLAYDLHDRHAYALDTSVLMTLLNPGIPILVIGSFEIGHFGAVLTVLPDSSLLVLRTLDDHPLGLEPGDIVLGYEGVAWKDLVDELLGSGIPILYYQRNSKSSVRYNELASAGMNWHLFNTIDIIKFAGGDTVHLPVNPLLNLPVSTREYWFGGEILMWNNEQLSVAGVPFPDPVKIVDNDQSVTFGIVEGTNVGYIYLMWEDDNTDAQFGKAVYALSGTEGLIIDLRINFGGVPNPRSGLNLLFNAHQYTMQDELRCSPDNFSLCPMSDQNDYFITGNPMSWYDRPMAVLTGPNCVSAGEYRAYIFGYHPLSRFFGKSTCAALGSWNDPGIGSLSGWKFLYPYTEAFLVDKPEIHLNHREFPVDYPVWFDRESVANGEDAVVKKALEWIQNVSYAHKAKVNPGYALPGTGEVTLTAKVENPNGHDLGVKAFITSIDSTVKETVSLFDDGNHGDGDAGDATWGIVWQVPDMKAIFSADLTAEDLTAVTTRTINSAVKFTTIGPVVVDGISYTGSDTVPEAGDNLAFKLVLRNHDLTTPVTKIKVKVTSLDTTLAKTSDINLGFADMAPGETSTNIGFLTFYINIDDDCPAEYSNTDQSRDIK